MKSGLAGNQFRCSYLAPLMIAILLGAVACSDVQQQTPTQPSFGVTSPSDTSRNRALERFPEMVEHLPSVRVVALGERLPPEASDDELVRAVTGSGGRVIVGFKPASARRSRETGVVAAIDRVSALAARTTVRALGVQITRSFRHSSAVAATIPPELAPQLRRLAVVDYVEASFPGQLQGSAAPDTFPQDTAWGARIVHAPDVWGSHYGWPVRGEGVFVTVLDGGVDETHRWWGDGPENMGYDCYWVQGTGTSCYDEQVGAKRGHGTHVAGIIASRADAFGYIGIANNLQGFASIKVCTSEGCLPEWVADALDWVLGSGRPRHIVNMSFGWCSNYSNIREMVARLDSAGVLLVASAGNIYSGADYATYCDPDEPRDLPDWPTSVMFPARYPQVMAVSGTLEDDQFAVAPPPPPGGGGGPPPPNPCEESGCGPSSGPRYAGSRFGPEVDIAAPFCAYSMVMGGHYAWNCGTSMSAPLVAGVAALVWSQNPTWTAAQVRERLQTTAIPYSPATQFGYGRVDALYAVHGQAPSYTADITGRSEVRPNARCSWSATSNSPDAPYTFEWFVDGVSAGFGEFLFYFTSGSAGFLLSVAIRDTQGRQMFGLRQVEVNGSAGECLDQ